VSSRESEKLASLFRRKPVVRVTAQMRLLKLPALKAIYSRGIFAYSHDILRDFGILLQYFEICIYFTISGRTPNDVMLHPNDVMQNPKVPQHPGWEILR
jgi:hypothetical protein